MQQATERNQSTLPVGNLGIIALESCKNLGNKINDYIVQWRNERNHEHEKNPLLKGKIVILKRTFNIHILLTTLPRFYIFYNPVMYLLDIYKRHLCCIMLFPLGSIYKIAKLSPHIMSKRMLEIAGRNTFLYYSVIHTEKKKKRQSHFKKISVPCLTAAASFE